MEYDFFIYIENELTVRIASREGIGRINGGCHLSFKGAVILFRRVSKSEIEMVYTQVMDNLIEKMIKKPLIYDLFLIIYFNFMGFYYS